MFVVNRSFNKLTIFKRILDENRIELNQTEVGDRVEVDDQVGDQIEVDDQVEVNNQIKENFDSDLSEKESEMGNKIDGILLHQNDFSESSTEETDYETDDEMDGDLPTDKNFIITGNYNATDYFNDL